MTVFKNKLLNYTIIIIIALTLLGFTGVFLYKNIFANKDPDPIQKVNGPTIDEILPLTVSVPKINTNLGDSSIIVIELMLQTDNEDVKVEAEKRMFQIKDRILLYLRNLTADSFATEEKIKRFKSDLIVKLNPLLQDGKIVNIDITQIFLQ